MGLASELLQKIQIGAREIQQDVLQGVGSATEFVRKNPVTSGVSVAGGVLAGLTAIQIIRKRRKPSVKRKAARKKPSRKPAARRKRVSRAHARVHKHRVHEGLDIIHKGRKKGISLKTIRAAITSPKTPPHLKKGLRKLLRKRSQ